MRREVSLWIDQASKDLEVAQKNMILQEYHVVAFYCQQAVEKALKALFIHIKKESSGATHSLIYLASSVSVPERFFDFLRGLAPEFIASRYPDASDEVPYKLYSENMVRVYLDRSDELLKWISSQMKQ